MEHVQDPRHFEKAVLRQILIAMARDGRIPSLNKRTQEQYEAIILLVNASLLTMQEGQKAIERLINRESKKVRS